MDRSLDDLANEDKASQRGGVRDNAKYDASSKRVYVANLAWKTSWQGLKDHMRCGNKFNVVRADVMTSNQRSLGCGVVEYETVEMAKEAMEELNESNLDGRQISVREDRGTNDRNPRPGNSPAKRGRDFGGDRSAGKRRRTSGGGGGRGFAEGVHRVYVGNLAYDMAWQDLKDHMRGHRDQLNPIRADITEDSEGRPSGCGIVEYASAREAIIAIQTLHDTFIKGRPIFVRRDFQGKGGGGRQDDSMFLPMGAEPRRNYGGGDSRVFQKPRSHVSRGNDVAGAKVYVGNLSWDVKWQDLKDYMRKAGEVLHADILETPDGRSKGCGLVEFASVEDANNAIDSLNDTVLNGRTIFVREDRQNN